MLCRAHESSQHAQAEIPTDDSCASARRFQQLEVSAASLLVQKAFVTSPEFLRAKVLALYAPIHNEVDTSEVLAEALAASKVGALSGRVWTASDLSAGLTTANNCRKVLSGFLNRLLHAKSHDPGEADLIVIPGIVFDIKGNRIGYGKGYYDKTLHSIEGQGKLVGFCYEFQLVEDISG